jgi:hypothetical protein
MAASTSTTREFRALVVVDYVDEMGAPHRALPGSTMRGLSVEAAGWLLETGAIEPMRRRGKEERGNGA